MSGIFGYLNEAPVEQLASMDAAMAHWGPDGGGLWHDDRCGLGQRLLFNTPEAIHEHLPRWIPEARLALTAEARIDNRDAVGSDIWERLAQPMRVADLCTELTQVYAVDQATCEADVLAVLNDMAASGLLNRA